MTMIMDERNERVEHNYIANSFERIFWEEQKKAKQLKNLKQMRWHPMLIMVLEDEADIIFSLQCVSIFRFVEPALWKNLV